MGIFFLWLWLLFGFSRPSRSGQEFIDQNQATFASSLKGYDVILPRKVTSDGNFLSHSLSHSQDLSSRKKRDLSHVVHYVIELDSKEHHIAMKPNFFVASHAVVERRSNGNSPLPSSSLLTTDDKTWCHFEGTVQNSTSSRVALSACSGLKGYIQTENDEYYIEPLPSNSTEEEAPHPHMVYRRSAVPTSVVSDTCGTPEDIRKVFEERCIWEEEKHTKRKRRRKRSVSVERNVEVLVVADKKMVDFYSNEDLNTYILTIFNMVSSLYHDASIGNAINIMLVKIILLEGPQYEEELEISHNADNTLKSFCEWQQMVNPQDEKNPYHHDVAVLLTRYNICSKMNERCSTLGLAEIAGMCQPHRSCNVNEDTGLTLAHTIAHELGHNFGMDHDGPHNGCENHFGVSQHVMAPHMTADVVPITWSNCSREEITRFLDREWGSCLEDQPAQPEFTFPELPPGAMYDADHQCRLTFGPGATHCQGIESVCQALWCRLDNKCITRLEAAAEGTQCGKHKWCSMGRCIAMGERPIAIHGNWGSWSPWSPCSRSCGAGVSSGDRHCDNPAPANGGTYCTGDRKRYRICNTQDCPDSNLSFRASQCGTFNHKPHKGYNSTWHPIILDDSPCQLNCRPDNEFYSVELQESVIDGTPCKPGTRNMCINGMCKRVTCDWTIGGKAQEDRCGLCHGDGTQCVTVKGDFNETFKSGYAEVVTLPVGATNIRIDELGRAANYFSVKDVATDEYYLNGNWVIQWSGEYYASGVIMYYRRVDEQESLFFPGSLKKPLKFMNPGVKWEYTLPHENVTYTPVFSWKHSDWSVCSVTCGGGVQVSETQCMEKEAGLVDDKYCRNQTRPDDSIRTCNTHFCPPWWWSGPWQPCSVTCGQSGTRRRTVICVKSYGPSEQVALLDADCDKAKKPHDTEPCPQLDPCPSNMTWDVGPWSQSCGSDPCDYQARNVTCLLYGSACDPLTKPPHARLCGNITCGTWQAEEWAGCSSSCGEGLQLRKISCTGGIACREADEPKSVRECYSECLHTDLVFTTSITSKDSLLDTANDLSNLTKVSDSLSFLPEMANSNVTINEDLPSELSIITDHLLNKTQKIVQNTDNSSIMELGTSIINNTGVNGTSFLSQSPPYNESAENLNKMSIVNDFSDVSNDVQLLNNTKSGNDLSVSNKNKSFIIKSENVTLSNLIAEEYDNVKTNNTKPTVKANVSEKNMSLQNLNSTGHLSHLEESTSLPLNISLPETIYSTECDAVRPQGFIDDKVNIEEFNLIEVVKVPAKNKKKRGKEKIKKIKIHQGEVAIDLVNEMQEKHIDLSYNSEQTISEDANEGAYLWALSEWSECTKNCGGGVQDRTVLCVENGTQITVESRFCSGEKPVTINECGKEMCSEWKVSVWGECSSECDMGIQIRNVTCPVFNKCTMEDKPQSQKTCNNGPCVKWVEGPWSMCTKSCGGGYQIRHVKCVDKATQEASEKCPLEFRPKNKRVCNKSACPASAKGHMKHCRDRMASNICKKLVHMCRTNFFSVKCCRTCSRNRKRSS